MRFVDMRSSVHFAAPNFNKNLNLLSEMCSRGEIREFTVQLHFFFLAPRFYSEAMKDFFFCWHGHSYAKKKEELAK